MKTILLSIVLAVTAFAAPLTVDGNMNVITNGSNFGRAEDFIAANPARTGEVMLAIRAFHAAVIADTAAKQAEANAAISAAEKSVADANVAKEAETNRASALVVAVAKVDPKMLPEDVKTALLTAAEKEKADLAAKKAEIEAKLAALP